MYAQPVNWCCSENTQYYNVLRLDVNAKAPAPSLRRLGVRCGQRTGLNTPNINILLRIQINGPRLDQHAAPPGNEFRDCDESPQPYRASFVLLLSLVSFACELDISKLAGHQGQSIHLLLLVGHRLHSIFRNAVL
ncbi:hypothetical protein PtA15_1A211 [Puccinia triticina]|uniref:Uncharacterized protein n=1 Tax=Puccinia triticina TaxID=208348 RepID=A0ABY7C6T8_9BASI|nr:uncharacterized protein PtA15_1A211 [Puccinia triticina]WAQ80873.1 hypothetical protein PtA15_1A211 [Puccinia triticina]